MSTYITKYTMVDGTTMEITTHRSAKTLSEFCNDLTRSEFVTHISRDSGRATVINTEHVVTMEVTKLDD